MAAIVIAVQYGRLGAPPFETLPTDAPPAGVDIVYARNPANPHGLVAYDWSGARRGSVKFPTWVEIARLRPAPDGSAFLIDPFSPGDYAAYFDRAGRTLFETNDEGFLSQAWADDRVHVCVLSSANGIALITRLPGQPDRAVQTPVGAEFALAACSVRADVAVLASTDEVVVARLSSGAVLRRHALPAGGTVLASTDAAYVAVTAMGTQPVGVYRTADLSTPVAELSANVTPLAFSGDDSLLLAGQAGALGPVEAIAWRTGKAAWTYDAGTTSAPLVIPRPSGGDFALYVGAGLVLVRRSGKADRIA